LLRLFVEVENDVEMLILELELRAEMFSDEDWIFGKRCWTPYKYFYGALDGGDDECSAACTEALDGSSGDWKYCLLESIVLVMAADSPGVRGTFEKVLRQVGVNRG